MANISREHAYKSVSISRVSKKIQHAKSIASYFRSFEFEFLEFHSHLPPRVWSECQDGQYRNKKKKSDIFEIKHTLTDDIDITSSRSLTLFVAPMIFTSDGLELRTSEAGASTTGLSHSGGDIQKSREGTCEEGQSKRERVEPC